MRLRWILGFVSIAGFILASCREFAGHLVDRSIDLFAPSPTASEVARMGPSEQIGGPAVDRQRRPFLSFIERARCHPAFGSGQFTTAPSDDMRLLA